LEPLKCVGVVDRIVYPFAVGGTSLKKDVSVRLDGIPIHTLHFVPKNPKAFFLGSVNCIYQKTSGGYSKIESGKLTGILSLLAINPNKPENLFASSKEGKAILSSSDGGTNWKEVRLGVSDFWGEPYTLCFNAFKFDIKNPNIISIASIGTRYVGTRYESKGIFLASLDGGENWDIAEVRDKAVYDVISNGDAIFFSTDKAIYRFTVTTQKTEKITDSPQNIKHLRISPTAKEKIFGATSDGKIYVSEDNGQSFTLLTDLKKNIRDLTVDPKSATNIIVVTDKEFYKTSDGGANWTKIGIKDLSDSEIYCVGINPENSDEIYIGTSKGLYITRDGGTNWTKEE
ncbi:MAG: WD40/YVTN/BNR-like repeat-containing protein, partial [Fervidobacterium sp.]